MQPKTKELSTKSYKSFRVFKYFGLNNKAFLKIVYYYLYLCNYELVAKVRILYSFTIYNMIKSKRNQIFTFSIHKQV